MDSQQQPQEPAQGPEKGKMPAAKGKDGWSTQEILAKKAKLPLLESVEQYKDVRMLTSQAIASLARQTIRMSMQCSCRNEVMDAALITLERVKTLQELYIALLVCMDDVLVKGKIIHPPETQTEPVEIQRGIFPILEDENEE